MPISALIETRKHYTTARSFRKDERRMIAAGWSLERLQLFDSLDGPLRRRLRRHRPAAVGARYLRRDWPDIS